jgi:O-antigen/teichoic acid export membrane protein
MAAQGISWLSTLVVIRLLHPEDYGLIAMASSVTSLAMLLNDMGLSTVIIQRPGLQDDEVRKLLGAAVLINLAFFIALALGAPLAALYYENPQVKPLIWVLALQFPIQSFGLVHAALLVRRIDFKTKGLVEAGSILIGCAVTLTMALSGAGVWALVAGQLIATSARSLGFSLLSRQRYRPSFRLASALPLLRFGGTVMLVRLAIWSHSTIDIFLLGRMYGADFLGFYSIARNLSQLPQTKIGAMVNQVALTSFSRIQNDDAQVRHYLERGIRLMAFVAVPIFWGISALAPEAIHVVLGERWLPAVDFVRILSLVIPLRMLMSLFNQVLFARGQPQRVLSNTLVFSCIVVCSVVAGSLWSVFAVCVALAGGYVTGTLLVTARVRPWTCLGLADLARLFSRPIAAAIVMYLTVEVVRALLEPTLQPLLRLPVLLGSGAAAYLSLILLLDRQLMRDTFNFVARA